ncbi:MAG: hypothetical protein JST87_05385 [Bacteroidetes bacterium]|nr:hypothetical protein [Bacteroidota bacterium]
MTHPRPSFVTKEKIEILHSTYYLVWLSGIDELWDKEVDIHELSYGLCDAYNALFFEWNCSQEEWNDIVKYFGSFGNTEKYNGFLFPEGELLPRIKLLEKILNNWDKYE